MLAIRGGHFAHEHDVAYSPHSGLVRLDRARVRYAEIAPVTDTSPAATDTITGTSAAETINVVNGPVVSGTQTLEVNSATNTFERIDLANKTSVTVAGGGAAIRSTST